MPHSLYLTPEKVKDLMPKQNHECTDRRKEVSFYDIVIQRGFLAKTSMTTTQQKSLTICLLQIFKFHIFNKEL